MKTRTPPDKKELDRRKQRRTGSMHGYVKSYHKAKARLNRAFRHQANTILKAAAINSSDDALEKTDAQALTRERLQHSVERFPGRHLKAQQDTLQEWVATRLRSRAASAGRKYFAETYDPKKHREWFKRHLRSILSSRPARAVVTAKFYDEVLNPRDSKAEAYYAQRLAWLEAFFADEPGCERDLRAWVTEVLHSLRTK